jgi:hypothetical protein
MDFMITHKHTHTHTHKENMTVHMDIAAKRIMSPGKKNGHKNQRKS